MTQDYWSNSGISGLHQQVIEVLSEGVYISDAEGMTIAVNSMYEQLTGLKCKEVIGKNVKELVGKGIYSVALNPEIVVTGEHKSSVQITKTGQKVLLNGYPICDESGKVCFVLTFVRDISLLSRLKEQIVEQQDTIIKYREANKHCKKVLKSNSEIFKSKKMLTLMEKLKRIAKTDATVLLLGETGVGKDVLAHKIHEYSARRNELFLKIDCSTIPENLIESELFGYDYGAFSGASTKGKAGLFEMADKGTLFLDEIGEIPLQLQVKLLRVLQDQEIIHIGSTKVRKVDVRFIAATNRNLEEEVKKGRFRSDLYYRLRVADLEIPPLRERKGDISAMMRAFFDKYNSKYRKQISFTKEVEQVFLSYKWPGNVRQLDNFIQSLVVTGEKKALDVQDLPQYMLINLNMEEDSADHHQEKSLDQLVRDYEKNLLKKALDQYKSGSKVAEVLRVDRSTIFRKAKKYNLL
ncbi:MULTISPECIES: sigma-54-dependent Fis family transcriptional regulator [Desulfitobacterium]|uniref:HTH-type transcriptional regulatory protein TyrR n=1 Tax=Desulfitobacterium dehalogenans (strain ATCC 51507 / DSM 9161 / JW/IU-DC1) TaxID=756499 RepID=I4A4E7_DESDJ|nr:MULTISPECIES: sigma 54-interacting transcriptional regulator [Desulfitobacterium]AFL98831.1 PAS domain S-box [Desulfitobacterium dehalogenans ATCC 51507]